MELIQQYTMSIISISKHFDEDIFIRYMKELVSYGCKLANREEVDVKVIDRFKCLITIKTDIDDTQNIYPSVMRIIKITDGMENLRNLGHRNLGFSVAVIKTTNVLVNPNNVKFSILIRCKDSVPLYDCKSIIGLCKGASFRERTGTMNEFSVVSKDDKNQIIIYSCCLFTITRFFDILMKCASSHIECFINHVIPKA